MFLVRHTIVLMGSLCFSIFSIVFSVSSLFLFGRMASVNQRSVLSPPTIRAGPAAQQRDDSIPNSRPTAWCILDDINSNPRYFHHFPHASQSLLPCWSYFCREREITPDAKCGFWVDSAKIELNGWAKDFVATMGCEVTSGQPPPTMDLYHRPSKRDRMTWFQNVSHANLLRKQIVRTVTRESRQDDKILHIGLVQRRGKWTSGDRYIRNLREIRKSIEERYPNATVETRHMERMNFTQQATWWSRQDVVVAAHGAAVTNLMFLPLNGSVIELYPDHYYPIDFYKRLSDASGTMHTAWWRKGVDDPDSDYRQHCHNVGDRNRYRNVDLSPPVYEVLELIEKAVG